jgi:hypothetical protein
MSEIKKRKPSKKEIEKFMKDWDFWQCDPSTFDWEYFNTETCYIIEGQVTVRTESDEENIEIDIEAGDLVTFPKGLKCVWDVKKPIRKVYTFE